MPKAHEWRWRPAPHCELPRFEPDCAAKHYLRGGRSAAGNDVVTILFLANSLVRQQFEWEQKSVIPFQDKAGATHNLLAVDLYLSLIHI